MTTKTDNRGFWEYSIFQKIVIPNEEQNIKISLKMIIKTMLYLKKKNYSFLRELNFYFINIHTTICARQIKHIVYI
jgi:hypothetical protein